MAKIITGRDAYVDGVACTTSWGFSSQANLSKYAASCTNRGTAVTNGVINETGTMSGIGGAPPSVITPGAELAFKGVVDASSGDKQCYAGTVLINSLQISANKEQGGPLEWSANFGVQGQLADYDEEPFPADATVASHAGASGIADALLINADGSGSPVAIPGFRSWNLNISAPEKTYVVNGVTHRKPGNIEASVTIDVFERALRNANYNPNVLKKLKLFIDASLFWHLEWIKFVGESNYVVNRRTQELLGYQIAGEWSCVNGSTLGHITRPGGSHLFGS